MAKMRRSVAYRRLERPYTRISKFLKKSYIRMTPPKKIIRFDMGNPNGEFDYEVDLIPQASLQIRQEAIESARQTSVRVLERELGKSGFHFKIRKFPFHVLRENPLAAGAGADRMSTGMKKAFGKPIGVSVQVREGEKLFTLRVNKAGLPVVRDAFRRASNKLPCSFKVVANAKAK